MSDASRSFTNPVRLRRLHRASRGRATALALGNSRPVDPRVHRRRPMAHQRQGDLSRHEGRGAADERADGERRLRGRQRQDPPQGFDPDANTDAFIKQIPDYVATACGRSRSACRAACPATKAR